MIWRVAQTQWMQTTSALDARKDVPLRDGDGGGGSDISASSRHWHLRPLVCQRVGTHFRTECLTIFQKCGYHGVSVRALCLD
eukprot:844329-Amphidinium_carterae.1